MFLRGEITLADGFDGYICIRLVFAGCRKALGGTPCLNCHNPELWPFETEGTEEERLSVLEAQLRDWTSPDSSSETLVDAITVVGGEPLDQDPAESERVLKLIREYYPEIPIFLYTGFDEEKFFRNKDYREHPLARDAKYIKFGPYVEEMRTPEGFEGRPFLGSINQNIYEVIRVKSAPPAYRKLSVE